jgi:nitrogen-specific signal transduction histidine kinase
LVSKVFSFVFLHFFVKLIPRNELYELQIDFWNEGLLYLTCYVAGHFWSIIDMKLKTYKFLVETIDSYIIQVDKNLNISFINQDFFGIPKEKMIGQVLSEYPFYNVEIFKKDLKRELIWEWKCNINGESEYFCSKSTPLFKNDEFTGMIILTTCVKQKVENTERENIIKQRELVLKSKNELLSIISHEIRSPLQSLSYSIDHLLDLKPNEKQLEVLLDIKNVYNFVSRIISDILDMSKIDSGQLKIELQKTSVLEIMEQSMNIINSRMNSLNLILNYSLDFNLPATFHGDKFRIVQILVNFLTNSTKFTKKGVIELSATMNSIDSKDYVRFSVKDEGKGIPEKLLKTIFVPFVQLEDKNTNPSE